MRHLTTIAPDGGISALRRKTGFDPRSIARVRMERSSEIEFDEAKQAFRVRILHGALGAYPTTGDWMTWATDYPLREKAVGWNGEDPTHQPVFPTYETAVEAEIALLQGARFRLGASVATSNEPYPASLRIAQANMSMEREYLSVPIK